MKRLLISVFAFIFLFPTFIITGCKDKEYFREIKFTYPNKPYEKIIGSKTVNEDFEDIIINPISNLRDDFIMGVDGSMIYEVEAQGGVYYNSEGKEQDVYQIMNENGVNFFRVRVWNNPYDKFGDGYGGGNVDVNKAVSMSKRAQDANMNILVDLHYSDFWADPETQTIPKSWASKTKDELVQEVKKFTADTLKKFKNKGVNVAMIQIGNEINNGMLWPVGKINWSEPGDDFAYLAKLISAGIEGAKEVFPDIYTAIHLANGGNFDEFDVFFGYMKKHKVKYDAIGVSYYPYYHGTLQALQNNMNQITKKYNKYVFVAETAYGYTDEYNAYTENIYNSSMEDEGKYLTSIQGQATAIRDVMQAVANVPDKRGLGIFYWEPAWLPIPNVGWANAASGLVTTNGKNTWANQGLFSYRGKALPSLEIFKKVKGDHKAVEETPIRLRAATAEYTINLADNETVPSTFPVITNLDAIRQFPITWSKTDFTQEGEYDITGTVQGLTGAGNITAKVTAIINFLKDPGYEKQGKTDAVIAPWKIVSVTPAGEKVVKLDRKTEMRSGTTNLNWYHGTKDFSFVVEQEITGLKAGVYELSTYCMAIQGHTQLEVYIKYTYNGQSIEKTFDLKDKVKGWGSKDTYYIKALIEDIQLNDNATVIIGIRGAAPAESWGHLDDWALVKKA